MIEVYKWVKGINKGNNDQVIDLVARTGHVAKLIPHHNSCYELQELSFLTYL